jgi:two-component system response regulator HydG
VQGSFTGAIADRPGHFVAAGGTVFLDEIGNVPSRYIEAPARPPEGRSAPSSNKAEGRRPVVAATNKNLQAMVGKSFRRTSHYA